MEYTEKRNRIIEHIYSDAELEGEEGFIVDLYSQIDDLDDLREYLSSTWDLTINTDFDQLLNSSLTAFDNNKEKLNEAVKKYVKDDLEEYYSLRGMDEYYDPEEFNNFNLDNLDTIGRFIVGLILLKDNIKGLKYSAFVLTVIMNF